MYTDGLVWYLAVILLTILLCGITWWIYIRTSKYHVLLSRIPGPTNLPLLGNTLELKSGFDGILEQFQTEWPQKYGEIYRIFIGPHCYVCLSSPELHEPILNSQKVIDKGNDYNLVVPWLGYGLLLSTDDKWRARRRLLTPAFHFKILENFFETFNNQSQIMCKILNEKLPKENKAVREIDIYPLVTRCSLDIICEAAMGIQIYSQTNKHSEYAVAVSEITQLITDRTQKPWLWNEFIFSLSSIGQKQNKLLKTLHGFTDNIINERRKIRNEHQSSNTANPTQEDNEIGIKNKLALLDLLLEASDGGRVLSQNDIREEIDTFMFEGHDTTASATSWFLYCMALYPEHQEKVVNELHNIFGDSERTCELQDLPNLKYLEMCIKEVLRIHPSVPAFERITKEEIKIGDYSIPPGCSLVFLTLTTHQNPKYFPDPDLFIPERFSSENSAGRHPYAYIPFSAGPRNCIGQRFALMELKVVLSTLLRRFKFELSPTAQQPVRSTQLVLKSLTGINLLVSSRR